MTISLIQFRDGNDARGVAASIDRAAPRRVVGATTTVGLAQAAIAAGRTLEAAIDAYGLGDAIDLSGVMLLSPVDHPDPAHLLMTGTGLTHLGSAEMRDKMHRAAAETDHQTDSMKMFLMGVDGGKPADGSIGVQPEWFFKGDGSSLVAPGAPLRSPAFAADAGEEPEIAGVYLIAADGTPFRLGFSLGNEFSDHVTERGNYLWLAHSKLRTAALGPELLLGDLPHDIRGTSRIIRDGATLWERPFLSGEVNMSHSIANLENHHFKYAQFRRPGDVHVHFYGTATLSFGDGVQTQSGDVFEIEAEPFMLPARNPVVVEPETIITVRAL